MEKEIIVTSDGSHSIAIPAIGVCYHSTHGAIQESMHVFIDAGLRYTNSLAGTCHDLSILEMGLGTGLNALLTIVEAEKNRQKIYYEALELHPLETQLYTELNYCEQLQRPDLQPLFNLIHSCPWNSTVTLSSYVRFRKIKQDLQVYQGAGLFNIIYFDAFAPEVQPELWTGAMFEKLYALTGRPGLLTTYCSKSIVRKAMTAAGWQVEKIPGPPHKREMVRAIKR